MAAHPDVKIDLRLHDGFVDLVEQELDRGEVVRLMPGWESPASPIHLVSPPERKHSAKVKAFMEHVAMAFMP
jgi:DNA-binding transcriptional LysR family regulator